MDMFLTCDTKASRIAVEICHLIQKEEKIPLSEKECNLLEIVVTEIYNRRSEEKQNLMEVKRLLLLELAKEFNLDSGHEEYCYHYNMVIYSLLIHMETLIRKAKDNPFLRTFQGLLAKHEIDFTTVKQE